jgi:hypothetical protein
LLHHRAGRQKAASTNQQGTACGAGKWRPHAQDGGDGDDETDEFKLDAAAVVAEEAVARKVACKTVAECELDVPEWQELAGDRLGWGNMSNSIKMWT